MCGPRQSFKPTKATCRRLRSASNKSINAVKIARRKFAGCFGR
jgi:hypothetical protein